MQCLKEVMNIQERDHCQSRFRNTSFQYVAVHQKLALIWAVLKALFIAAVVFFYEHVPWLWTSCLYKLHDLSLGDLISVCCVFTLSGLWPPGYDSISFFFFFFLTAVLFQASLSTPSSLPAFLCPMNINAPFDCCHDPFRFGSCSLLEGHC